MDGTGSHAFVIDSAVLDQIEPGDRIAFEATWVGPTREVVTSQTAATLSETPWAVELTVSPDQPLPGYEFGSTIVVQLLESGDRVTGAAARTTLYEDGDGAVVSAANGEIAVGAQIGSCSSIAGAGGAGCPMTLPAVGKYIIVTCTTDPAGAQVCAESETIALQSHCPVCLRIPP